MKKMKISKYSVFFEKETNEKYVYNTLSNCLLKISNDTFYKLKELRGKFIDIKNIQLSKEIIEALSESKNLVNSTLDDEDNLNILHLKMLMSRFDKTNMNLTLVPTQACNFNCTYCYEKYRPNINMDENTKKNIIKLILNSNVKHLHIRFYCEFSGKYKHVIA